MMIVNAMLMTYAYSTAVVRVRAFTMAMEIRNVIFEGMWTGKLEENFFWGGICLKVTLG